MQEELPPLHQVIPTKHNTKLVERVCSPKQDGLKTDKQSKNTVDGSICHRSKVTSNNVSQKSGYSEDLDENFNDHLNTSLAVIESMEFLNDSMSLLYIEQKNKKAGAVSISIIYIKFKFILNYSLEKSIVSDTLSFEISLFKII